MSAAGDINYIRRMFQHPCATPDYHVLVQTGLAAGTIAVVELFTAGCLDILKLKAGKPFFHHKGLKGLLSKQLTPAAKGQFFTAFDIPFGAIEAGLNYFWLLGVGTGFVANWQSMIYTAQRCQLPGKGYFTCPISTIYLGAEGEGTILLNGISESECFRVGSNKIIIPAGCSATISYEAPWLPFANNPANAGHVESWLETKEGVPTNVVLSTASGSPAVEYTAGGLSNVTGTLFGDAEITLKFRVKSGLMGCSAGTLRISGYGRPIHLVPTGCKPKKLDQPYPTPPEPPPPKTPLDIDQLNTLYAGLRASHKAAKQPKARRAKPPRAPRPKRGRPHH